MVRTAAGIRISAGRSSKKVGKTSGATPSSVTNNKSKAGSSSSKLPPIPFQETPSWQKPITNFFKSNSPLKATENKSEEKDQIIIDENSKDAGPVVKKKLKLGSNDESDSEENTSVQESEENGDNKTCEDTNDDQTTEENKENALKSTAGVDDGAGSSKD